MSKAEDFLNGKKYAGVENFEFNTENPKGELVVSLVNAFEGVRLARKEGYEQAQDDYGIVTEGDPAFKELSKIFNKKKVQLGE